MLHRRITQVVTVGVFAVAAFWLLLVILLFAQFAPGTNAIGASTEASVTTTAPPASTTTVPELASTTTTTTAESGDEVVPVVDLEAGTIAYRVVRGDTLSEIGARFGARNTLRREEMRVDANDEELLVPAAIEDSDASAFG